MFAFSTGSSSSTDTITSGSYMLDILSLNLTLPDFLKLLKLCLAADVLPACGTYGCDQLELIHVSVHAILIDLPEGSFTIAGNTVSFQYLVAASPFPVSFR